MTRDDPEVTLAAFATAYRLSQQLNQHRRHLSSIGARYSSLRNDLDDFYASWERWQKEFCFDALLYSPGEVPDRSWDLRRFADRAKQLRRELLDLLKRADPNYPDAQEYASYCTAVDGMVADLLGDRSDP